MTERQRELHAEYEAARIAYDDASKAYRAAQDTLWRAERAWDRAGDKMQRAFAALAKEPSALGEVGDRENG